tara:strand:+ start:51 stop:671 length:621 start_codon:yes stop_codon:yes gene_type:complete
LKEIINNIKIFSSFWVLLFLYLVIPIFIDSISAPRWIYFIDYKIPFIPFMIIPYYFYYFIIILPPFIWKNEWKLRNITGILNVITLICYLFFILWPIDASHILNQVVFPSTSLFEPYHSLITYNYLHQNAFPSMHVAVSSFLCLSYYNDFKSYRFLSLFIGLIIFLSTFLIKQHYVIDSISGLFLGFGGFYYYFIKMKPCKNDGIV